MIGILYYTCCTHDARIENTCRRQLERARGGHELGTVSLCPIEFGDWNIVLPFRRCPETMHRQILAGLERLRTDVVFLAESDVLYHPSHFEFVPDKPDTFYYNVNVWRMRFEDGFCVRTEACQQVSGVCAYRDLLLDFYRLRVAQIEREGFNRHYEPGSKQTVGSRRVENWQAPYPNLDIRHAGTLTRSHWSPGSFRNKRYAAGWQETDEVPGWGFTAELLHEVTHG